MKVTLSKLKINKEMSEETTAFTAEIHLDERVVGTVMNRGHGGSHIYQWTNSAARIAITEYANSLPTEFKFEKLDQFINDLVAKTFENQTLLRLCKTKLVYRYEGDKPDAWMTIKAQDTPEDRIRESRHAASCNKVIAEWANDRFK